jgi:hypothetical protein
VSKRRGPQRGNGGRNGKSVFHAVCSAVLGNYAQTVPVEAPIRWCPVSDVDSWANPRVSVPGTRPGANSSFV